MLQTATWKYYLEDVMPNSIRLSMSAIRSRLESFYSGLYYFMFVKNELKSTVQICGFLRDEQGRRYVAY